jgi:hypothetical protein
MTPRNYGVKLIRKFNGELYTSVIVKPAAAGGYGACISVGPKILIALLALLPPVAWNGNT